MTLSSNFNKHEFVCRMGVVTCISGKVSFRTCAVVSVALQQNC